MTRYTGCSACSWSPCLCASKTSCGPSRNVRCPVFYGHDVTWRWRTPHLLIMFPPHWPLISVMACRTNFVATSRTLFRQIKLWEDAFVRPLRFIRFKSFPNKMNSFGRATSWQCVCIHVLTTLHTEMYPDFTCTYCDRALSLFHTHSVFLIVMSRTRTWSTFLFLIKTTSCSSSSASTSFPLSTTSDTFPSFSFLCYIFGNTSHIWTRTCQLNWVKSCLLIGFNASLVRLVGVISTTVCLTTVAILMCKPCLTRWILFKVLQECDGFTEFWRLKNLVLRTGFSVSAIQKPRNRLGTPCFFLHTSVILLRLNLLLSLRSFLYKALCVCPIQNDVDPTKAAPVLNSSKADSTSAAKPSSMALDDTEMRKLMEECKRLQSEVSKLGDENRHLKVQKERTEQRGTVHRIEQNVYLHEQRNVPTDARDTHTYSCG